MAADCISNTGESYTVSHSDLITLQQLASSASMDIEMDIQYSKEEAHLLHDKLLPHKGEAIVKGFLEFLKKSDGFIVY